MSFTDFSINRYNNEIEHIAETMLDLGFNREGADCFMELVTVLNSSNVKFTRPKKLAEGICGIIKKFSLDENFCEKCTNVILSLMGETESKSQALHS